MADVRQMILMGMRTACGRGALCMKFRSFSYGIAAAAVVVSCMVPMRAVRKLAVVLRHRTGSTLPCLNLQ